MKLHFWNVDNHETYAAAFATGEYYECNAPAYEDEVDRWGFNGGILCDAMQAITTALDCVGMGGSINAALVIDGKVIKLWNE